MAKTKERENGMKPIDATLRLWQQYTPSASSITNGPCDAVLVTVDAATITAQPADSSDAAAVSPPLAKNVWHPMACNIISAVSSGNVYVGWYKS